MLVAERLSTQQLHEFAQMQDDGFEADDSRPLIPEGFYKVRGIKREKVYLHNRTPKLIVTFKITSPAQYEGTELFMAINLIDTKTGKEFKKVPSGSKYYEQWVIANGNIKPSRKDRMSPVIFINGYFEAYVRTVKPKFKDGTYKPDTFYYSIIDYLKDRIQ